MLFTLKRVAPDRVRVGLLLGAVAAVLGAAGLTWRRHVANGLWQAAMEEVRVVEARLESDVVERQALWGETTDDRAQPHYERALSLVAGWDSEAVRTAWQAEDEPARVARSALVTEGREALEALHRGAHAADATPRVDWSLGFEHPIRLLLHARYLTQLCEMKAAILLADGRDVEAVGVVLDALQFAGDMAQGPLMIEEMIGLALLSPDVLLDGVADGTWLALPDGAGERLAAGVAALDERLTWRMTSLEPELVLAARGLDRLLQDGGGNLSVSAGWMRSIPGISQDRIYAAEHVTTMRGICDELDGAFRAGPAALFDAIARFPERTDLLENPISVLVLPRVDTAYQGRFFALGRFRLLAHAISGAERPRDPWLAEYMREEATEAGTHLWLDHEMFGGVEILVAR